MKMSVHLKRILVPTVPHVPTLLVLTPVTVPGQDILGHYAIQVILFKVDNLRHDHVLIR